MTSVASLRTMRLVNDDGEPDEATIEAGSGWLEKKFDTLLPAGAGYLVQLQVVTPDRLHSGEFRSLAPWVFEDAGDPLVGCES